MGTVKPGLDQRLADAARLRGRNNQQRTRRALRYEGGMQVTLDGRKLINFSSNDYLGLAHDERLAQAAADGARNHGVGSGASALVTGYREVHSRLEEELADFLQRDRVLLCPSGYQANLAVLGSLAARGDTIIQDRLCHASLIDGARLSGARLRRYPHRDTEALVRQIDSGEAGYTLVVTDGVFSMDGDRAPLKVLSDICIKRDASLVVDDAHGIGVTGPGGRGSVARERLGQHEVPVLTGTLGKALGCAGAFIAGSEALIEHVVNEGRTYLFTTAMSPAIAEAARTALAIVQDEAWRRERLDQNISRFREGARALGLEMPESDTPIQPLLLGAAGRALELAEALQDMGLLVSAIRPPTVPAGSSRLRITLSALHEEAQIELLLGGLSKCLGSQ